MNLNAINRLATFSFRLSDLKKVTEPIMETLPQKPEIPRTLGGTSLERVRPESMGISSQVILDYVKKISSDKTLNMHNIMILRGGKVLYECNFGGHDITVPKMTFSACKSITSIAIGMLIDDGLISLEDSAASILEEKINLIDKIRLDGIKVEDLLTMRSTVDFNEAESFTSTNWVKSFFSSVTSGKIGETFCYNSLNSYILSAIVYRKTGKHISEYLSERLFEPLGIVDFAWEKCPMGIEKGGWGLYMRPEDIGKIGTLVMNGGVWRGKRIVSKEYLDAATSSHVMIPAETGDFNYGYHIWVGKDTDTFLFNGMLGQNVLGFRKNGIIIVSNAGNGELFQQGNFYDITLKTFSEDFMQKIPANTLARTELERFTKTLAFGCGKPRLAGKIKIFDELEKILVSDFETKDERAVSFGLMPVILQVVQNNYTKGVKSISLVPNRKNECIDIIFREAEGEYVFSAGLSRGISAELSFGGEKFIVCSFARFGHDEDGRAVLTVRSDFIETPCSRIFKFYFDDGDMVCRAMEAPGAEFILRCAGDMLEELFEGTVVSKIADKLDMGYVYYKLEKLFSQELAFSRNPVAYDGDQV